MFFMANLPSHHQISLFILEESLSRSSPDDFPVSLIGLNWVALSPLLLRPAAGKGEWDFQGLFRPVVIYPMGLGKSLPSLILCFSPVTLEERRKEKKKKIRFL